MRNTALFIGLMSGTSLDGVDGVLVDLSRASPRVLEHVYVAFDAPFAAELLALNTPGPDEVHRCALAANGLARRYAQVVQRLLNASGTPAEAVQAIGAHGQTIRHRPQEFDASGYTVQLNNPALLAEWTGIDVVADFRSRDVAAGGQGAPLVPAFHQAVFGQTTQPTCVLNVGGIANLTVLPHASGDRRAGDGAADPVPAGSVPAGSVPAGSVPAGSVPAGSAPASPGAAQCDGGAAPSPLLGFDCGPGNALMDHWSMRHLGTPFDGDGAWADSGSVHAPLLQRLLAEPYLSKPPPKSTGRDLFNPAWLTERLQPFAGLPAADVQASLCAFTAQACADAVRQYATQTRLLVVCGGGALNASLMQRLQQALPQAVVEPSSRHGLPPLQVEAVAFAWLAHKALRRETASLASVTGARGARVLGAVYPR